MIKVTNLDQIKDSLKGFIDGINRLSFTSDVVQEVQENVRESRDLPQGKNEALKEATYQSHLRHDSRGIRDAVRRLPPEDRQRENVENDLIDKYIIDYLNQIFSEV